jgi:hypothetical protein
MGLFNYNLQLMSLCLKCDSLVTECSRISLSGSRVSRRFMAFRRRQSYRRQLVYEAPLPIGNLQEHGGGDDAG